jgi:hypothetical protein
MEMVQLDKPRSRMTTGHKWIPYKPVIKDEDAHLLLGPSTSRMPTDEDEDGGVVYGLFTSNVFEGIRGDCFEYREIPDSPFTTPGLGGIILRYPDIFPPF